jgi:hypothetical protein
MVARHASPRSLFGLWWADALGIVYVAGREGIEHWRTEELDDCCP